MTNTEALGAVHEVLETSDLPRRLAEARKHPEYTEAMRFVPASPRPELFIVLLIVIAGFGAGCLGLTIHMIDEGADAPSVLLLAGATAMLAAIWKYLWTYWRTLARGAIHRELFAVLDLEVHDHHDAGSSYRLTLWNHETLPRRVKLAVGRPDIGIGDVGVAIFRGKLLVKLWKIPVDWQAAAA